MCVRRHGSEVACDRLRSSGVLAKCIYVRRYVYEYSELELERKCREINNEIKNLKRCCHSLKNSKKK